MKKHISEHIIPRSFASIYEQAEQLNYDMNRYCILRDNFYQNNRSLYQSKQISKTELEYKFSDEPKLKNETFKRYACANAKYYSRLFNINPPEWASQFDNQKINLLPIRTYARQVKEDYLNTPVELRELGFIDHYKNFIVV